MQRNEESGPLSSGLKSKFEALKSLVQKEEVHQAQINHSASARNFEIVACQKSCGNSTQKPLQMQNPIIL